MLVGYLYDTLILSPPNTSSSSSSRKQTANKKQASQHTAKRNSFGKIDLLGKFYDEEFKKLDFALEAAVEVLEGPVKKKVENLPAIENSTKKAKERVKYERIVAKGKKLHKKRKFLGSYDDIPAIHHEGIKRVKGQLCLAIDFPLSSFQLRELQRYGQIYPLFQRDMPTELEIGLHAIVSGQQF